MAQSASPSYPVVLRASLTEPLSRWLFLVKWLLIIPHVVVLLFLYIGCLVAWVISLFAILFTGRYPRDLFRFIVGVLRWTWRVGFYSYQALGTDRYPPFSLEKDADYPADLDVAYPEKLENWLALVKWWLLALPHYVVLAFLQGGSGARFGGLNLVLVLFAGVANLFTGRYPPDIWRLVMGINHWTYRVAGYAALMTDEYPPFRLGE